MRKIIIWVVVMFALGFAAVIAWCDYHDWLAFGLVLAMFIGACGLTNAIDEYKKGGCR